MKIGFNQIITSQQHLGKIEFSYNFYRLLIKKCNLIKHFQKFQDMFNAHDLLERLLCFDKDKVENISLGGSFGNKNFHYLEFTVSSCKNGTDPNIICKPKEEVDNKLKGWFFIVNHLETKFDTKNFTYQMFIQKGIFTNLYQINILKK